MSNVVDISHYQQLDAIIRARFGSDTFCLAIKLKDGAGICTYIPNGILDDELCYLIDTLNERRRQLNEE